MTPWTAARRPPCPSPTPRVYSNSCLSCRWCPPTTSPSVVPFSSHPQPFPASWTFPVSQFFTLGGQSTGASASAPVSGPAVPRVRAFHGKVLSRALFSSLCYPTFGLLSHFSSLRSPSGRSGRSSVLALSRGSSVLALSSAARPPRPAPACWCGHKHLGCFSAGSRLRRLTCGFYLFIFFLPVRCPLRFQNAPQTHRWEGFLVFGNFSSFTTPSPGRVSIPNSFVFLCLLHSVLPPFEDNGLPFWVPGILSQHSVVLWNLLV